jgi:hypothetical protein
MLCKRIKYVVVLARGDTRSGIANFDHRMARLLPVQSNPDFPLFGKLHPIRN